MLCSNSVSWKTELFPNHFLAKTINLRQDSSLPDIFIFPEYHETQPSREQERLAEIDRSANQAAIERVYTPGDILLVEESYGEMIDQSTLPQTKGLSVPVKIWGWDDRKSKQKLAEIYDLYLKCLPCLMEEDYRQACKTEEYQCALDTLKAQDYRSWTDLQLPFSAIKLPNPMMNDSEYWQAIHRTQFAVLDHFYHTIPQCFRDRQQSLGNRAMEVLTQSNPAHLIIMGGYNHFLLPARSTDPKRAEAIEGFYRTLESTGRSVAILTPPQATKFYLES